MKKRSLIFAAVTLILIGLAFLIANIIPALDWRTFWPIFFIIPLFVLIDQMLQNPENRQSYITGLVLIGASMLLLLIWSTGLGYYHMEKLWPLFIAILGVSLIPLGVDKSSYTVIYTGALLVIIASTLSLFSFKLIVLEQYLQRIWPLLLIYMGIYFLIMHWRKNNQIMHHCGLLLIITGMFSLPFSLKIVELTVIKTIWPLFIIISGLYLLYTWWASHRKQPKN